MTDGTDEVSEWKEVKRETREVKLGDIDETYSFGESFGNLAAAAAEVTTAVFAVLP